MYLFVCFCYSLGWDPNLNYWPNWVVKSTRKWYNSILDIKSKSNQNQITFIVTSPQHKCLGEWNSYERAPDSAEKQQAIYIWTDSAKKQQTIYIWTDSAKKQQTIYIWTDSAKKQQQQFTYGQTVQKKTTNNLHMDRQCKKLHWSIYSAPDSAKKQQQQFTYGQTVQKKQQTIYIWTDSAKKQQQFTYGQYIFTDCTEDNVQNTHTYTQYT